MSNKRAGVWMDHIEARILEPDKSPAQACVVHSLSEGGIVREPGGEADGVRLGNHRSSNNEYSKHKVAQEELHRYFRDLANELLGYDHLFIFGPGTAHNEFANWLMKDKHFKGKTIHFERTDHLSDKQFIAKVKEHFFKEEGELKD